MIPRRPRRALKSDLNFCFMSRMVLDRVCGTNGLGDPDVRDAISTLDDIAKDASGNDKKVKLETRGQPRHKARQELAACDSFMKYSRF